MTKQPLLTFLIALLFACCGSSKGYAQRERILLDEDWLFAFGNAASPSFRTQRRSLFIEIR